MASTSELIDYMSYQAPGWNRIGANKSLIEVLNQAQDILYKQNSAQTVARLADGTLPKLDTVAGTAKYTLNQSATGLTVDIWRCESVLTRTQLPIEYGLIGLEQARVVDVVRYSGLEYYNYFYCTLRDALRNGHPELTFVIDPGTTTDSFYLLCHEKPIPLTSESIQVALPEQLHIPVLLPAAQKLLEGHQNGNYIEAVQYVYEKFRPMAMSEMNEGEQGRLNTVTRHEE